MSHNNFRGDNVFFFSFVVLQEALSLLEPMLTDSVSFVQQVGVLHNVSESVICFK